MTRYRCRSGYRYSVVTYTLATRKHNQPLYPSISPSNTAKLSSPLLLPRTISYDGSSNPPRRGDAYRNMSEEKTGRRRRSSSLLYQEPPESIEHMSDQAALPNLNANWVNAKGAWTIHIVIIACLKIFYDIIPGGSSAAGGAATSGRMSSFFSSGRSSVGGNG
ncbi:hypothetical protein O988_03901 [Pseudogymnoascus sp. VKM F-3808]|nr:hypothetical protein O988_03901 [Pseudogymnoascus sp. VKM F-3808]